MNLKFALKKYFFDLFGKANYNKGLKEFDEESAKEFAEYAAKKTPYTEFITIDHIYKVLEEEVIPDTVIANMFETFTSEGWPYIKGYFRLLQKAIEKRLVYSNISDREWLVRRIEHGIYDRIFAYEDEIRNRFKENQKKQAGQKLNDNIKQ